MNVPPLEKILIDQIKTQGALDVGQFMSLALSHPQHGYYMTRDPLGRSGDFITAPEVSQLFGEMIAVWAMDLWQQMGSPAEFILLECGPGRGTLMADLLRASAHVPGFREAAKLHLVEISPALKAKQKEALAGYNPVWHDNLQSVPSDAPMIIIGNEFLDALPFHQLQKTEEGWAERVVEYDGDFRFGLRKIRPELLRLIPGHLFDTKTGNVFEVAPARQECAAKIAAKIKVQGGGVLLIDYGPVQSGCGDTLQALRANQFVDVFEAIGHADLTSHVDFEALALAARQGGAFVHGPVTQGEFLRNLGIDLRGAALKQHAAPKAAQDLEKGLHRLCDSGQMGMLFKVIGFSAYHGAALKPAGF